MNLAFHQVYTSHIYHVIENSYFCTTYKSSVSPHFADHAYLTYLMLQRQLNCPAYKHLCTDNIENIVPLLHTIVAKKTCLLAKLLLSNSCCTVASFVVVA
jgi:hypothetical protein